MKLLENKNALITGCRRGIGRATLERFAAQGANVWAHVRAVTREFEVTASELAKKCGVQIRPIGFDLADHEAIKSGVKEIHSHKIPIDILVNNAGIVPESRLFLMTPIEQIRRVTEINYLSQILLTQLVSRSMVRQKRGSIIFLSSIAGLDGDPAQTEYSASKGAINAAVKKLAREFAPFGVRVNAVAPGLIDTDMGGAMSEELREQTVGSTLLKRPGKPEEVADAILFLASGMSSFMTGQILRVDGGR
ncbi:MAG: SDR family NAD(P)-dependent oxidoreductase [Thermoguttaceae bacterium]|jgi:3-oxoacyl-[acyl-carrier protein] reductase